MNKRELSESEDSFDDCVLDSMAEISASLSVIIELTSPENYEELSKEQIATISKLHVLCKEWLPKIEVLEKELCESL